MIGVLKFFRNQQIQPFEVCFALFCVYSGVSGVLNYGPANVALREVLGDFLSSVSNVVFLLAGLALYFGIGLRRKDIEGFGLILLAVSLLVRMIATINKDLDEPGMPPQFMNTYVYSSVFIVAIGFRLLLLLTHRDIVEVRTLGELASKLPPDAKR